jgi:quinol monooxygenase YgiN
VGETGITLTGTIRCAPDEVAIPSAAIPEHVRLTRTEPGCVHFVILPTADRCLFEVEERFADAAAFATHQARTRASPWWSRTGHMVREFRIRRG